MAKTKYYVVWKGRKRGIFPTWAECERQVKGFEGAEFKAFGSAAEARAAFAAGYAREGGRLAHEGKTEAKCTQAAPAQPNRGRGLLRISRLA